EDDDVTHVEGRIDPVSDAEIVETELMLADLESLERRLPALEKKAKGGDKDARATMALIETALVLLREGKPARLAEIAPDQRAAYRALNLLTSKPVLYVCNVDEASAATGNAYSRAVVERAHADGAAAVVISAAIEAEVAQLTPAERDEYLREL